MPDALSASALIATLSIVVLVATLSVAALLGRNRPVGSLVLCGLLFLLASLPYWLRREWPEWFGFADPVQQGNQWLLYGSLWWLCAASVANQGLRVLLWDGLCRYRFGRPMPRILSDTIAAAIYLGALFAIIGFVFGREVTGLLATSGIIAVILGLAMQTTLSDLFSGVALGLTHAVSVGDFIDVGDGLRGRVVETSWRATRIVTRDAVEVTIPNGHMARAAIRNHSRAGSAVASHVTVDLDPSVPPGRARRLLRAAVLQARCIREDPAPAVRVAGIFDGAVRYDVQFWCDDFEDDPDHVDEVATAVCDHLSYAGVDLALAAHRRFHSRAPARARPAPLAPEELLRRHPLFRCLEETEVDALAANLRRVATHEGETVLRQGDAGDSLYLVAEGLLDVQVATPLGHERVGRLGPGDFFGEMSLLTGQPRSATVVARTPTVAFEVTRRQLKPVLARRPVIVDEMSRVVAERQLTNERAQRPAAEQQVLSYADALRGRVLRFFHLQPRSHAAGT